MRAFALLLVLASASAFVARSSVSMIQRGPKKAAPAAAKVRARAVSVAARGERGRSAPAVWWLAAVERAPQSLRRALAVLASRAAPGLPSLERANARGCPLTQILPRPLFARAAGREGRPLRAEEGGARPRAGGAGGVGPELGRLRVRRPVSYTHLTLPTICSV